MVGKLIVRTFVWFGAMGALMFLAAGTWRWPGAWIYLIGMMALSLVSGLWMARRDPGLLAERLGSPVQKDQPTADKILLIVFFLALFGWLVLMGLDVRFGWSPVPVWGQALGALLLALSMWIITATMMANSFAAPVVKIQRDRGQTVISTGPYGYVRHPMYSGSIPYFVGTALLLGSWWGVAATAALALILAIRIPIEEKALRAGLEGYDDYAVRVPYRLVPRLW
jgi:protein-S-isoprenylcysteine O-methyltransferase Ste14